MDKISDKFKPEESSLKRLLIIDKSQFGQLIDVYKWCENLKDKYKITVISADLGYKRIRMKNVRVLYIPFKFPYHLRAYLFVLVSVLFILIHRGPILIEYFPKCTIFKRLFPGKRFLLDVRTLSVSPDVLHRTQYNNGVKEACSKFNKISVISRGIADQIGCSHAHIIPLGSDVISTKKHEYTNQIKLLYVGTLRWRRIEDTIEGVLQFIKQNPKIPITYDIVGDGIEGQIEELNNIIKQKKLENVIKLHGRIPYDELSVFFDNSNVGISYVPITEYYQNQPPTKTFEYCNSGLYCIATNTLANKELITDDNGCLIEDSPYGVCQGLKNFLLVSDIINEEKIKASLSQYSWYSIVKNKLSVVLDT